MKFFADFHIHSKYSRATAKNLDFENIYIAGQLKGISVIGTGDFTHPGWFLEIKEKLERTAGGLYKLKESIAKECNKYIPASCRRDVLFMLVAEISNIYKKDGKTRKNHNLIFLPDLETAEKFNSKLDRIGNIKSDGRPILGLDARDLLEITMETSDESFFIPAHIWTPWFSLLGSKSGFDSIEECFEDLTKNIFAVETGLSSDPEMNRRVACLDGLTLISNSDAHSPMKLGREANIFDTELTFSDIREAIKTSDAEKFLGTIEFYPEEGKYHIDGHRKCKFRSWPKDTLKKRGICPVCGKELTLGVLYRVEQLADRQHNEIPEKIAPYYHTIPLQSILSEILKVGPTSKRVNKTFKYLLKNIGSEFDILHNKEIGELENADVPLLGEAVRRVRYKKIHINPGYDGEFGTIKIFEPQERDELLGQRKMFVGLQKELTDSVENRKDNIKKQNDFFQKKSKIKNNYKSVKIENNKMNRWQQAAIYHNQGPIIIIAGPGTGKTLTITHRIAHLIGKKKINPSNILGLTFTNKAAEEMISRLKGMLLNKNKTPLITTFHSFCLNVLKDLYEQYVVIDDVERKYFLLESKKIVEASGMEVFIPIDSLVKFIIKLKQEIRTPEEILSDSNICNILKKVYFTYQDILAVQQLWDYEDLICGAVLALEQNESLREQYNETYRYIFVDEYQDINYGQYRMMQALSQTGQEICVIGDPNQAIYGFRGSDVRYFNHFKKDYPKAEIVCLTRNYRSTETILDASQQVISKRKERTSQEKLISEIKGGLKKINIFECSDQKSEAIMIGKKIESLIGGIGLYSVDFGKIEDSIGNKERTFSDIAILYRMKQQHEFFSEAFSTAGIPYQIASKDIDSYNKGVSILLSFLKILEKRGSYIDIETILDYVVTGVGKKIRSNWKRWAYNNRYPVWTALDDTRKFPIKGMKTEHQMLLSKFAKKIFLMEKESRQLPLNDKVEYILNNSLVKEKIQVEFKESLETFIQFISEFNGDTASLIRKMALQSDTDVYKPISEKVTLMTMHAAKGLEFPVVFIVGCEDGYIPFKRDGNELEDEDEERRLFYVAMTRAKEELYISYAKKRRIYGEIKERTISPFIKDIDESNKQYLRQQNRKKTGDTQKQLSLFE